MMVSKRQTAFGVLPVVLFLGLAVACGPASGMRTSDGDSNPNQPVFGGEMTMKEHNQNMRDAREQQKFEDDKNQDQQQVQNPAPATTPTPQPAPVAPEAATGPTPAPTAPDVSTHPLAPSTGSCKYVSNISTEPPKGKNKVVLTFDDGPDENLTPGVLDTLKKYGIKATFFVVGENASAHPDLVQRIRAEGHFVGNHSWNHPDFHTLSLDLQEKQFNNTQTLLLGVNQPVRYFRYPYGDSTCEMNGELHKEGYTIVGWHIDSCDWAYSESDKGEVSGEDAANCEVKPENQDNFVGHVVQQVNAHHGGIVLMHDIHSRTISKLEPIIQQLLQQGYQFVNLDDPDYQSSLR